VLGALASGTQSEVTFQSLAPFRPPAETTSQGTRALRAEDRTHEPRAARPRGERPEHPANAPTTP
jgi:hypothetical protein